MKVLWVSPNFLHPTTKGGQIRTLEMLRHLHRWHEIHYAAVEAPAQPEGVERAGEYCSRCYPMRLRIPPRHSLGFAWQVIKGLVSPRPVALDRFYSPRLGEFLEKLMRQEHFDRAVVDFLVPATYFPDLEHSLLFQHNVETMIWKRHASNAADPVRRFYFRVQEKRMFSAERRACQAAGQIVAVSEEDAQTMRDLFGVTRVTAIPTGVNPEYFARPAQPEFVADLVFVGSMDWLANLDGVMYFLDEILPLIREKRPDCRLAIVGRTPPKSLYDRTAHDEQILVTGTVPDVRPYLWGAHASIVPLRIGGGTRLKIYESMAAGVPVVSSTIGAEGLEVCPQKNILIADSPWDFAECCLRLLSDGGARRGIAEQGLELATRFSWEKIARRFSNILEASPPLS